MFKTHELVKCLKSHCDETGLVKLKTIYRPYIAPYDLLLNIFKRDDVVADIGCGTGQFILLLSEFVKPEEIFGFEISDFLVSAAQRNLKNYSRVQINKYDGNTFPDCIRKCNIVILNDVLHHIETDLQQPFLNNLFNKLESGSRLILKDIDAGSLLVYFNKLHDFILSHEISRERKVTELTKMCKIAGFKILDIKHCRKLVYPHIYIICEKA